MSLLGLPVELLCEISEHLRLQQDLWSLVLTNRFLYRQFNQYLYRFDQEHCDSSALLWAASVGNKRTAQISLGARTSVPGRDEIMQKALQIAIKSTCYEIVTLLIDNGGDLNAPVDYFGNLLQLASWLGDQKMMELLIDRGADVNVQGGYYGNVLQATSWIGNEKITNLLISRGAHVNEQGGFFGNALQGASWGGNEAVTKLLINSGADIDAQGGFYGDALQAASGRGHIAIVKQLISRGAKVNSTGGQYNSARQAASIGGHKRIEGLLRYWYWRQYLRGKMTAIRKTDWIEQFS